MKEEITLSTKKIATQIAISRLLDSEDQYKAVTHAIRHTMSATEFEDILHLSDRIYDQKVGHGGVDGNDELAF